MLFVYMSLKLLKLLLFKDKSINNQRVFFGVIVDKILFFDGVCVMCNELTKFILKHDKNGVIKFATLQGNTAKSTLPSPLIAGLNTVVLKDDHNLYTQSDAIIRLLASLGGIFKLALLLLVFPKKLRDYVYGIVSRNRYRWFGTTASCGLLSQQEKARILD